MLVLFSLLSCLLPAASLQFSTDNAALALACARNPKLAYCPVRARAKGTRSMQVEEQETVEKERFRQAAVDRAACLELRDEYMKVCAVTTKRHMENDSAEFCEAYETVCFEIPEGEPDQPTLPPLAAAELPPPVKRPRDYTELCREYKQRYLYVCPDPFRFGQKAIIFCPLYAQKCHVPLPDKPVVPTRPPPYSRVRSAVSTVDRLCAQYRNFAVNYCNNPLVLSQPRYSDACSKYNRFCVRRGFKL